MMLSIPETLTQDYLMGNVDIEGLKAIFTRVDENRASIIKKQQELETLLKRFPKFRSGIMQLATTYLQLGKTAEALKTLSNYHNIDSNDATVEYYLSALFAERVDYLKSWEHLKKAQKLTEEKDHRPKALKALRNHLRNFCPDPNPSKSTSH